MNRDQILAALPALAKDDLVAVQAVASRLLAAPTSGNEPGAGLVGQAIFNALTAALGLATPFAGLAGDTARRFNKHAPIFAKFLDEHFKGWCDNKITQTAFLRMMFGLIVSDLKSRNVNPTIGIVVVNMGRIPEVFNGAFPGYLEAGLGAVILKSFQK